ncbi:ABC transporter substrate-binding protein [Brachyspira hyodysenteriae]|uniref:ABC transporter substrate-binding protein n=1 Tax=Brachyspira hyodysenteriae TaxID=159 RepID=UPI00063D9DC4|nr:ABC transporter substrate-binding protein [Brachyspira hyodysenteriae]KLI29913.1 sugar ABC transporter substrate-binding protein [Brachyspira hyodysenteriae]MCZ9840113.1 ABC transporter substrate-binding protein [Brachyspira hyodysenteriae]MCZ9848513.1 ABC transporter substrate-binding protein [Brachyspira hyodysenteriae]MCZ9852239.1 ABC transporter substrate-binding protein [Brachyspira hyodysenteriae]MCZ9861862.1 ABC transporter substrate-binding protein [Brachyspira hyodysenteriae]
MKKYLYSLFIITSMILISCSSEKSNSNSASAGDKVFKIGILQLIEHDALDASYRGFVDGLKEAGYEDGKNIIIDYQNAQGEQANCVTIGQKFVNDKSDLILAIATPAAQAVANMTKDIPILVTAVTDPAAAKLVADNNAPGGNVSGTSDLTPVEAQIELLNEITPNLKTVGLLYCSSEQNSVFQMDIAKKKLDSMGIKYIDATVTSANEIQQVVQSVVGKVEAIYTPTDNMIAAGMATVALVAEPAKLPVVCGEGGMTMLGGTATYAISYYELGKLTATQAVAILKGEKQPATMPIETLKTFDLVVNTNMVNSIGITIPESLYNK